MQHRSRRPPPPPPSPLDPDTLRRRADTLLELAAGIERSSVVGLVDAPPVEADRRARLCHDLLRRNVHQLHAAAEDLRERALVLLHRADRCDEPGRRSGT